MKLEQQVPKLEYCQRLKELRVKQVSAFYWSGDEKLFFGDADEVPLSLPHISAFTVAELGEMLPSVDGQGWFESVKFKHGHRIDFKVNEKMIKNTVISVTEADARAKCLIYLLENDLIKANDL